MVFANLVYEALLYFSPQRDGQGESFFSGDRQMEKALPHGTSGRDRQQTLLAKQIEIPGEGCGVHNEDFRDFANRNWLILGDGSEDRELSGADAGILEGPVK